MRISDRFDADLDRWEKELALLEVSSATSLAPGPLAILNKLNKLEHQQRSMQGMVDFCRQSEAIEIPMSPSSREILFWACEWADRVDDFRLRYADYLNKLLWLNLFRGRLLGRKKFFCLDITEHDVQLLLQRKQSLEQAEGLLQSELSGLQQQETSLREKYQRHQYELSNFEAAQSFNYSAGALSKQRSISDAFGQLLRTLSVHLSHSPSQVEQIHQLTAKYSERSQLLLDQYSNLMRKNSDDESPANIARSRSIEETLRSIRHLESEIEMTLSALGSETLAAQSALRFQQIPPPLSREASDMSNRL